MKRGGGGNGARDSGTRQSTPTVTPRSALLLGVAIGHTFAATGRAGVIEAINDAIARIERGELLAPINANG